MNINKLFHYRSFQVLILAALVLSRCQAQQPTKSEPSNAEVAAIVSANQEEKPYTTTQKTFTFDGIHTDKDYHWYVTTVVGAEKRVHCREVRNMTDLLFPNFFGKNDRIQEIQVFADLTNPSQESYVTVTLWKYKDHPDDTVSLFQIHMHDAGNIEFN